MGMTTIAQCPSVDEARLLKSLLEANGIVAVLPDEFTSQNLTPMLLSAGVKVQVEDEDVEAAREILAQSDFESEPEPSA